MEVKNQKTSDRSKFCDGELLQVLLEGENTRFCSQLINETYAYFSTTKEKLSHSPSKMT